MASSSSQGSVDSNSQRLLDSKDLPSLRCLGQGLSGFLYETIWDGKKYARKDFPLGSVKRNCIFEKEAKSLFKLDDQNIVKCFGYTVGTSSCSLLQEYADDNLQNIIQRRIEEYKKKNSTSTSSSGVLALEDVERFLSREVKEKENTGIDEGSLEMPRSTIPFKMPEAALDIISQIATGMKYLHDQEVVHGDLKPKNVLVCLDPEEMEAYEMELDETEPHEMESDEMELVKIIVKVADFGLVETKKRIKLVSKRTRHSEILTWKAPELFSKLLTENSDDPFTDSDSDSDEVEKSGIFLKSRLAMADVYSFGLTCSHVLGGKLIYPDLSLTQLRKHRSGVFKPELPSSCPEYLKALIYSCLKSDPLSRPTFSDIYSVLKGLQLEQPQLQGATSSSSQEMVMEPIVQVNEAIAIIDSLERDFISKPVTWNKHQCKRIVRRYYGIGERFKSMGWNSDGGGASDGGPIFVELLKILKKGSALISGYAQGMTSYVLSRTENREAFQEIHEELDTLEAAFGFQDLWEDVVLTPGMKLNILKRDADEDRKEMRDIILPRMLTTGMVRSKKLAQVFSDKTADVDVKKLVQEHVEASDKSQHGGASSALPSYLTIDVKSEIRIDAVPRIRTYVLQSKRDRPEEVGWASVKSGKWLGCNFAIKVFKCGSGDIRAEWNESQLLMEVGPLIELQHPHVVRLVGFGQDEEECVFVMELMGGDLRQLMKRRLKNSNSHLDRPFTESEELDIINQIAKGMYFMHTKGYAHGDLKCSNILVNELGEHLEVKISDLRGSQNLEKVWDLEESKQASRTRRPRWTAPEAIDHDGGVQPSMELLKQSDVYSFGMTCFEIVTGKYPFHGIREGGGPLLECINEGAEKWNLFPREVDKDLKGLIKSCWNKDPSHRPNFREICRLVDIIRSKRLADMMIESYGGMLAAILSRIKQIPAVNPVFTGVGILASGISKGPEVEFIQSYCNVEDVADHLMIHPNQLKRVKPIGLGSVYEATWLGCTFAVKILRSYAITPELQREVDFLIKVSRHPCIVQMVGLSKNPQGEYSIVMEYMDGNLRQLIEARLKDKSRKGRPFTFDEEVLIITKIAWGMAYLHSRGLVHRDLSSVNVLAQDYSGIVDVKIVDFGTSYLEGSSKSGERYYTGEGAGFYRAPEMLPIPDDNEELPPELPKKCTCLKAKPEECTCVKADLCALKATDVYSFGILCHEVLTGDFPCSELKATDYAEIRQGYRPKLPVYRHPELKLLIERCWGVAPKGRPTFIEICNDLQDIFKYNLQV